MVYLVYLNPSVSGVHSVMSCTRRLLTFFIYIHGLRNSGSLLF